MKPSIQYSNPHVTYEFKLAHTPRWTAFLVIVGIAMMLTGTIYLTVTADEPVVSLHAPKPTVPNVSAEIQQKVDKVVEKVVGK